MSLLLKITLSIIVVLVANGIIGVVMLPVDLSNYVHSFKNKRIYYAIISAILLLLTICYIPFMFIWHLY